MISKPASKDDRGEPDATLRALMARSSSQLDYVRTLVAACTARLILPIVVTDGESAAVCVRSQTGEQALLGFSGADALHAWRSDVRPLLCTLDDLAATVIEAKADALILDIAGPHPFTIEMDVIEQLAQGRRLIEFDDQTFGWVHVSGQDQMISTDAAAGTSATTD